MTSADERETIEAEIMEKIRKENREYKREWRKQNPDKVKAANERYWRKRIMKEMEVAQNGKNEQPHLSAYQASCANNRAFSILLA